MIPGIESRFVIPFVAIYEFGWEWWQAFPIAIAGNMVLVPLGLIFLHKIEEYLRNFQSCERAMNKIFPKIRKKADKKVERYECLALVFFVAIPLPFTGAGLGTLIAYLFDLKFFSSLLMIFIGVVVSASFTTFLFLTGHYIFFMFR